jgi:hypothetical protein
MLCPDTKALGILVGCLVAAKHQDLFTHIGQRPFATAPAFYEIVS